MNIFNSVTSTVCKYEILAEISFHNKTSENQTVRLLCSRLLARYRPREKCSEFVVSGNTSMDETDKKKENNCDYKDKLLFNEDKHSPVDELNEQDISRQNVSSKEEACSSIEEQFTNLSTSESQHHADWYAYWEKNGEDFVNETWIKQYGSCTVDDLPMDPEELYTKHCEQQYHILYWKFVNETAAEVEKHTHENFENDQCSSDYSDDLDNVDHISNFDFLYKYKHFQDVNTKLTKAYWAISIMGYIYNEQNRFKSAFVEYLKTNLVKSTRHLNMYRFPKVCGSSSADHPVTSNSDDCAKKNKKNKKALKKEKRKQYRYNQIVKELERYGYSYLQNNPTLLKYWIKRHLLFSEFEKGIQLDEESWYSVTPEIISSHIAKRCSCYLIIDPFCGAGGNVIQFAKTCELVIAIDNDPKKIEIARHNAKLYGVDDRIQFIVGDYFALAPTLKADVVFLSPPWGGPDLMNLEEYKLSYVMPENGGIDRLLCLARHITSNVALYLPKNTNIFDCIDLADDGFVEIQQNVLNSRYNSLTVYYSELYGICEETVDACDVSV